MTKTGYALFSDKVLIDCGLLKTSTKTDNKLETMYRQVKQLVGKSFVDVIVLEDVQYQSNQQTYKKLSMLLGYLLSIADDFNIGKEILTPTQWRTTLAIPLRNENNKPFKRVQLKELSIQKVRELTGKELQEDTAEAVCIGLAYLTKEGLLL